MARRGRSTSTDASRSWSEPRFFDPLTPIELRVGARPVELHDGPKIEVHPANGPAFVVRPAPFELTAVTALLASVDGVAELAGPTATEEDDGFDWFTPSESPEPKREITLNDLDPLDPQVEADAIEALAAGDYERALAAAWAMARQSNPDEREQWNDLAEVVTVLRAGDRAAALLWARTVRQIPDPASDALYRRLAHELERHNELVLAWSAADQLVDPAGLDQCARLEAQLERDAGSLGPELAVRAQEFFRVGARAGDPLAQRGLAQACMELDQLDDALDWVRRAIAGAPLDFTSRMLETEILGERDDDRAQVAALRKAAADFPTRPEPLVDLADHLEFDQPSEAIALLREAQTRRFDEFTLVDLVDLLAANGRHGDVVHEIEDAFRDPDSIPLVVDDLREKLASARATLGLRTKPVARAPIASPGPAAPAAPASTTLPVVAVVLMVTIAVLGLAIVLTT